MADADVTLEVEGQQAADYSPTTTGWYDRLPESRYVEYLVTWVGVAELMSEGRQQEIDAESMALLAWAPHDTVAYEAADSLISSGRYPGLEMLHNKVYGNGMAKDGYENLDFPQINRQDVEQYNVDMIGSVEGNGYVPTMQTGPFYSPGVFEKVAAWLGNFAGDTMELTSGLMGDDFKERVEGREELTADDIAGGAPATPGDVFYTASQYGTSPENAGIMDARILAGDIGQFAAEGYLIGAGLGTARTIASTSKVPPTGVNAAAQSAGTSVQQGTSMSQAIVQSINKFKSTGRAANIWNTSRGTRWGSAAISTGTLATLIGRAAFGDVNMQDVTGNLSPETQGRLTETIEGQRATQPPFRTDTRPQLDTSSAVGRFGAAQRDRFEGNSVAEAWQQQQADKQREE